MIRTLALTILILAQQPTEACIFDRICQRIVGMWEPEFPFHYAERTNEELSRIYLDEAARCFYSKKPSTELALMGDQLRQNDRFNPLSMEIRDMLENYGIYEQRRTFRMR